MTTALDTNVVVALWDTDDALNSAALETLNSAFHRGGLVISGAVYAELTSFPKRSANFLDRFLTETQISVDWTINERIWRSAGSAFRAYPDRRRKRGAEGPRRILADFLIGAHALENNYSFLTLDDRIYRAAFPNLQIFRA